jgi:alpha-1,2-mannosyltransferase
LAKSGIGRIGASFIFGAALIVRLGPLVLHRSLFGVLAYDDGVHFAAAAHLLSGSLPYRDFVFVQPPGIALLLVPFVLLGHLVGDSAALAMARLVVIAMSAATAVLVAKLAGRYGRVAGVTAGLVYATWSASVSAERTVLLEPILNFALTLGLYLLTVRDSPRRALAAGVVIGASVLVKLWAVPVAIVIVLWLLGAGMRQSAARFATGVAVCAGVGALPFFVAAPVQMWDQIVVDQLGRPRAGGSLAERAVFFGRGLNGLSKHLPGTLILAALTFLVVLVILGSWEYPLGRLCSLLLIVQLAELASAPSFYDHYADFVAPALVILLGLSWSRVWSLAQSWRPGDALVKVLAGVVLLGLAFSSVYHAGGGSVDNRAMIAFAQRYACVWTSSASGAVAANHEIANTTDGCGFQVDLYGLMMTDTHTSGAQDLLLLRTQTPAWQHEVRSELGRSGAALLSGSPSQQGWSAPTVQDFLQGFRQVGASDGWQFWVARNPAG